MLRPIENSIREIKLLDGLWRFTSSSISSPGSSLLPGNLECPVPSSYNDLFVTPSLKDHVGKVWYQKTTHIPRGWKGKESRIFLRVDSATHEGEVYIGEKLVVKHVGGYMPFEVDITDHVIDEEKDEILITIGVNNILTFETIPPGRVDIDSVGNRKQKVL